MAVLPSATPPRFEDSHPLELIPFFRRWPCGFWRDLLYTFIWNTSLALVFSMFALLWTSNLGLQRVLWLNFVYAQCIGYTIHGLYMAAYTLIPRTRSLSGAWRWVTFGAIPVIGVLGGFFIGQWLLGASSVSQWFFSPRGMIALVANALLIAGLLLAVMIPRERAAAAQAREETRVAAAERQAALAQLKALEAQVEPHFLYNTLAHVASLIDADPPQARAMLDRLIALLRATAKTASGEATLGSQAALLRAYLDILAIRMGSRLTWTIDVPPALLQLEIPPALLQPLVENAVKHGIEPAIEGGSIAIAARAVDGALELSVADTGAGFRSETAPIGRLNAARLVGAQTAAGRVVRRRRHAYHHRKSTARRARDASPSDACHAMNDRKPTAIIADDETRLATFLKERLNALWPDLVVAGIAANGAQAQALLATEAPEIAFLDIRMPGLSGLDVARAADPDVHVVFVTAFDQYAVDAFEREACDYLLKPVSDERLAQTCERLKRRLADREPSPGLANALAALAQAVPGLKPAGGRLGWLRAAVGQEVRLISVDDVCYFEANDKYTSVFTADAEALIRMPLKELIGQLDPDRFWQVHRGTVVNLGHVVATRRDLAGRVTLGFKSRADRVAVSRAYAHRFKQM